MRNYLTEFSSKEIAPSIAPSIIGKYSSGHSFSLWLTRCRNSLSLWIIFALAELDTIGDSAGSIASPEEMLLYKTEREEQVQEATDLVQMISASLTAVQFRRLWLHHVRQVNVRSIAKAEGVAHPSVVASITSAQKKIFKIVQKHTTKKS